MKSTRLDKLSALTRGAALIGIGLAGVGCTKQGDEPVHVNAPPQPQPSAGAEPANANPPQPAHINAPQPAVNDTAPTQAGNGGDAGIPVRKFPIPNAMPSRFDTADGGKIEKK